MQQYFTEALLAVSFAFLGVDSTYGSVFTSTNWTHLETSHQTKTTAHAWVDPSLLASRHSRNTTTVHVRRLGESLKNLRNKLRDESFDFPLERRPEEVAKLFDDRHGDRVRNIVFVHQDLVGGSVPVQILKRYLLEHKSRSGGVTAVEASVQPPMNVFFKRVTFKQIQSMDQWAVAKPCWVTLVRQPHQRALSQYARFAHTYLPHIRRHGMGPGLRTDDDTTSAHHSQLLDAFVRQDPATLRRLPALRYRPQFTSFSSDGGAAAASVLRKNDVLLGFTERMEEFLVMMRHRFGWVDSRPLLFVDMRSTSHSHSHTPHVIDSGLQAVLDLQPEMKEEVVFYKLMRVYYLEQVRGFGMGRLETETLRFKAVLAALHKACLSPEDKGGGDTRSETSPPSSSSSFDWSTGGFGTFGTSKKKKKNKKKAQRGRRRGRSRKLLEDSGTAGGVGGSTVAAGGGGASRGEGADSGRGLLQAITKHERSSSSSSSSSFMSPFLSPIFAQQFDPSNTLAIAQGAPSIPPPPPAGAPPSSSASSRWWGGGGSAVGGVTTTQTAQSPSEKAYLRKPPPSVNSLEPSPPLSSPSTNIGSKHGVGNTLDLGGGKVLREKKSVRLAEEDLRSVAASGGGGKSGVSVARGAGAPAGGVAGERFAGPREVEKCSTTKAGLVHSCERGEASDRLEFTTQCMLHKYDACKRHPETKSPYCAT